MQPKKANRALAYERTSENGCQILLARKGFVIPLVAESTYIKFFAGIKNLGQREKATILSRSWNGSGHPE